MTYCVGIKLADGIVLLSDTRTNAGVDDIAQFTKMFTWENPKERVIALAASGNLSITQGVTNHISRALARAATDDNLETLLNCDSMYRAAELVGLAMREQRRKYFDGQTQSDKLYAATILLAGQRRGGRPRLFMVYAEGNFVEATDDTPFLQIGEIKYGKPILDRVIQPRTSLDDAIKAACLSMDSTLRSNLSVGMPLDLVVFKTDTFAFAKRRRIEAADPAFKAMSVFWSDELRTAFRKIPNV